MVNGQGPFRFIVDTGANHSTISPGLVQTLGLQPSEEASIVLDGITGSAQVAFVTIDRLQAGDMTIEATALPVVSADVMGGADGILGAAGFTSKSLMVDFQHNRVAIAGNVAAAVRTEAMKVHAVRLTHGLITLETRVGGVRVQAVIDTGSERTLGNLALRDALRMPGRRGAVVQVTSVYGATEKIEAGEIRIAPTIAIESLRVTDVAIVYGDFHIFKVWGMVDKPAMIIGMDVLGTVPVLGIDFEKQDVYLAGVQEKGSASMFGVMRGLSNDQMMKK
jgi:predicted aspartyl protease